MYQHWEYFLNIKSLKSSDNNCGISIFTNSLKIKLQPNTLRQRLSIPLHEKLTFQRMQILPSFFHNDISIYKKLKMVSTLYLKLKCILIRIKLRHIYIMMTISG